MDKAGHPMLRWKSLWEWGDKFLWICPHFNSVRLRGINQYHCYKFHSARQSQWSGNRDWLDTILTQMLNDAILDRIVVKMNLNLFNFTICENILIKYNFPYWFSTCHISNKKVVSFLMFLPWDGSYEKLADNEWEGWLMDELFTRHFREQVFITADDNRVLSV